MKNINMRKWYYNIRHRYLTMNNIVMVIALFIAASWAWGSVSVMERNYTLQHEIDSKNRQLKLVKLETETLKYQQQYYKSDEYKELAVRQRLGLVMPGEKVLILPPNSAAASQEDSDQNSGLLRRAIKPSNFQQWMNFLFGGNQHDLQQ